MNNAFCIFTNIKIYITAINIIAIIKNYENNTMIIKNLKVNIYPVSVWYIHVTYAIFRFILNYIILKTHIMHICKYKNISKLVFEISNVTKIFIIFFP